MRPDPIELHTPSGERMSLKFTGLLNGFFAVANLGWFALYGTPVHLVIGILCTACFLHSLLSKGGRG